MMDIFYFDGKVKKAKDIKSIKSRPVWIDITNIKKEESETIQKTFKIHPLTIEDLQNSARIKVEDFTDYLFAVFYSISKKKVIELNEMDFIIGKDYIITSHKKPLETFEKLKNTTDKLEALFKKGIDFIFHKFLDMEVDNFPPILEGFDDEIESIEDKVTKNPEAELVNKILKIKRSLSTVRKVAFSQREKISFITKNQYPHISKKAIPYFRDVYDHSILVSDSVETHHEAVTNTFEVYMSAISNNMNQVMKVLSVIATIALPLTVISGIYGTNFKNLPLSGWTYGFWSMIVLMALMCMVMVLYFRKKSWF